MSGTQRDLEFRVLTTLEASGLDQATRKLQDLGDVGRTAGDDLDDLGRDLEAVGDKAVAAGRRVDDGFDAMGKSSDVAKRNIDDDTDSIKHSFRDVADEAGGTGKEMAASFSGAGDDITGAFQELAANAGEAFGPIGVAAGVAAGVGIGLITANAEKLKETIQGFVQDMIDAGGRLTEEAINTRITTMATEDVANFTKFNEQARFLGINITDITRARAGDIDAIKRVRDQLDELDRKYDDSGRAGVQAQRGPQKAMGDLRLELSTTTGAIEQAEAAVAQASGATAKDVDADAKATRASWSALRQNLESGVTAPVFVDAPSQGELNAINRHIELGIGTVTVVPRVVLPGDMFYRSRP